MNEKDSSDDTDDDGADDSLSELVDSIKNRESAADEDAEPQDSLAELADSADEFIWAGDSDPSDDEVTDNETGFSGEIEDKLANADSILVLGPLRGEVCNETCINLLTTPPADAVMYVTAMHTIENRVEVTREYAERMPNHISVLRVGGDDRARERSTLSTKGGTAEFSVQGVSDASDLTRLGIAINRHLSDWERSTRNAMCVHSLTELLQYVDEQRLFRFIHILQAKLETANTVAHFHLNPASHATETVSVFKTLFDYVVEVDTDGSVSVTETDE